VTRIPENGQEMRLLWAHFNLVKILSPTFKGNEKFDEKFLSQNFAQLLRWNH
jgi:hypothetical protein